jgi:hypothetical protein
MTFKFKSQATGDLVMVQAHAEAVLRHIGKTAAGQGILVPEDMPAALAVLRALPDQTETTAKPDGDEPEDQALPAFQDDAVSLRKRAWPLARMVEEAMAAGKPIVWGV